MPAYLYVVLVVAWIAWSSAFLSQRGAHGAARINKQARWGVVLQLIAYSLLLQGHFWERSPGTKLIPALLLLLVAVYLSWTGVAALGRHWRIDAGLNADHQLVRSGPYAMIRHPIYTSMLCVLLGTGLILTPWPLFLAAIIVFMIGTEIRIRIEDRLLASQFGEEFNVYRRKVPAYVPWLR